MDGLSLVSPADHILSLLVFVPLLGSILCLIFPRGEAHGVRGFALAVTVIDFGLAIWAWSRFDTSSAAMQLVESTEWIPSWGISYQVGVDGLSLLLIVLTCALSPLVVLSTYSAVKTQEREYLLCLLFLQTGILGAFVALDLFLFYVFWEVMLVPMCFLIGIWGGPRRVYAAVKFFLYTMAGSVLMLVAILYTVFAVKPAEAALTFSWSEVAERLSHTSLGSTELWLFAAFALAFAIKVPCFPFHTWLPDAHVEAPTGGSVILAGVLLKLGTYGFLRYAFYLFPRAAGQCLPFLAALAVIGIIYGALVAMVQQDLKRLVAYSSVSHLGFVILGICAMTTTALTGGVLQMVNHGISTGALFFLVGVLYERRHTRELADFGGVAKVMPMYATLFVMIALSSMGVPGFNGFVGEFLILLGTFDSQGLTIVNSTGEMASYANGLLGAVGLFVLVASLTLWARHVEREKVGTLGKWGLLVLSIVFVCALFCPAVLVFGGGFRGGLLAWPLAALLEDSNSFVHIFPLFAVVSGLGVILSAVYLLIAVKRVFFGPISHVENQSLSDLSLREVVILAPLVVATLVMGVYPKPFIATIEPTVTAYAQRFRAESKVYAPEVAARHAR